MVNPDSRRTAQTAGRPHFRCRAHPRGNLHKLSNTLFPHETQIAFSFPIFPSVLNRWNECQYIAGRPAALRREGHMLSRANQSPLQGLRLAGTSIFFLLTSAAIGQQLETIPPGFGKPLGAPRDDMVPGCVCPPSCSQRLFPHQAHKPADRQMGLRLTPALPLRMSRWARKARRSRHRRHGSRHEHDR